MNSHEMPSFPTLTEGPFFLLYVSFAQFVARYIVQYKYETTKRFNTTI
jgi:hypothetical protein